MKTIKTIRGLALALLFLLALHLSARYLGLVLYNMSVRETMVGQGWMGDYASYYFGMTKQNSVDTVFVGNSHQFCSVDINLLNREYGENCMLLASSSQGFDLSCYSVMTAIEMQHPKTIVLETLAATFSKRTEAPLARCLLGNLPNWLRAKFLAAKAMGSNEDAQYFPVFYYPICEFHSKWYELRAEDFRLPPRMKDGERFSFRYTRVEPQKPWEPIPAERKAPMPDAAAEWLEKIVALCEENGVRLILYTAPYPASESAQEIFNGLEDFAREHGLVYRNMMYDTEAIGLDPACDYMDGGHLNCTGQEKLTRFLAETLLAA